jgi:catechol 2,3-dioxygenase-like lactoylglutathione lyase family enzyme
MERNVRFAVQSIDHVEVFVRSIPDAIRWYGDVLGLREMARWDPEPVMIGAGGTQLALFQAGPSTEVVEPPALRWHRVAWKTDRAGFEAAQAHLASMGISFRGPVDHGTAWSIYFQDPDGHPLEITCAS